MKRAIDVSNYTTGFSRANVLLARDSFMVEEVVAACQFPSSFIPQAEITLAAGLRLAAYRFFYQGIDARSQLHDARLLCRDYRVRRLWLDFEQPDSGTMTPEWWAILVDEMAMIPSGVYTNPNNWDGFADASISGPALGPLWLPNWDNTPDLPAVSFGGWAQAAGKQYQSPLQIGDIQVDADVFADWVHAA